jgi:hypothetical protein
MSVRHIPTVLAALFAVAASGFGAGAQADDTMRSSPPDQNSYYRPLIPDDLDPPTSNSGSSGAKRPQFDVFVVDTVVSNTDLI